MKTHFYIVFLSLFIISCNQKTGQKADVTIPKTDTIQQKNGSVLTYEKPGKTFVFLKRDQSVYSENYQKRLAKIAEYYIANTQSSLVKFHSSKPESVLGYSVEENDWEGVKYTQIGIFVKSGSNMSTLQWLFYEPKSQKLYEFDLNTKKLQEFR